MESNENLFRNMIQSDVVKLNLIQKAKQCMYQYFKDWSKDALDDCLGADFNLNTINNHVKLVKCGVQINVTQDYLFCYNLSFMITSQNNNFLCNYYSYFDINGGLIDQFIDR